MARSLEEQAELQALLDIATEEYAPETKSDPRGELPRGPELRTTDPVPGGQGGILNRIAKAYAKGVPPCLGHER